MKTHTQCKAALGAKEAVKIAYLPLKSCSPKRDVHPTPRWGLLIKGVSDGLRAAASRHIAPSRCLPARRQRVPRGPRPLPRAGWAYKQGEIHIYMWTYMHKMPFSPITALFWHSKGRGDCRAQQGCSALGGTWPAGSRSRGRQGRQGCPPRHGFSVPVRLQASLQPCLFLPRQPLSSGIRLKISGSKWPGFHCTHRWESGEIPQTRNIWGLCFPPDQQKGILVGMWRGGTSCSKQRPSLTPRPPSRGDAGVL